MRAIGFLFGVALAAGWFWLFEQLWNVVVGGIFNGPTLSYWQSAAVWIFLVVITLPFRGRK